MLSEYAVPNFGQNDIKKIATSVNTYGFVFRKDTITNAEYTVGSRLYCSQHSLHNLNLPSINDSKISCGELVIWLELGIESSLDANAPRSMFGFARFA